MLAPVRLYGTHVTLGSGEVGVKMASRDNQKRRTRRALGALQQSAGSEIGILEGAVGDLLERAVATQPPELGPEPAAMQERPLR